MNRYFFFLFFILTSCASLKNLDNGACNENLKFKTKFYGSIQTIEEFTKERTTISPHINKISTSAFLKSLDFIIKYSKAPYPNVLNLQSGYHSMAEFQEDKKKWLDWYEHNKCMNIH